MNNYGFVKVAAATPSVRVADCEYNSEQIISLIKEAEAQNVSTVVFPESCITGYSCGDLFSQQLLLEQAEVWLGKICESTKGLSVIVIVGLPLVVGSRLYNAGVVMCNGQIYGVVPKTFLPNYNEFYDKRWYTSARELSESITELCGEIVPIGANMVFKTGEYTFAIEICEDLWTPIPPSCRHSLFGAEIIFNLSASNDTAGKAAYRKSLVGMQSARCIVGYVYATAGNGESTQDVVFSGDSMIAENGIILNQAERFSFENQLIIADIDLEKLQSDRLENNSFSLAEYHTLSELQYRNIYVEVPKREKNGAKFQRYVHPTPFIPIGDTSVNERFEEIFSIQIGGLSKRLLHTGIKDSVVGVSGGLDSTLALLVLVRTYDRLNIPRQHIHGITMPGFGTTGRTYNNAIKLMELLGITVKEISIEKAVLQHFEDIGHDRTVHDVTYENAQARERTQILMDYANKVNGLVIGTGDLSELALGWCTYNGDHMSMYSINAGVPKTLVQAMVKWEGVNHKDESIRAILLDVAETPVSPELLPTNSDGELTQVTEDLVGPYILHDFFLYHVLRFGFSPSKIYFLAQHAFKGQFENVEILKWLKIFFKRFFTQQFKRSCLPDGPKVLSISLSPRGDWRMPSDASMNLWMKDLEKLS